MIKTKPFFVFARGRVPLRAPRGASITRTRRRMYEDELTTEQEEIGYFGIPVADEVVRVERHRIPASLPYGFPSWDKWARSKRRASARPNAFTGWVPSGRQAGTESRIFDFHPARGNRGARHAGDDGDHCALP